MENYLNKNGVFQFITQAFDLFQAVNNLNVHTLNIF